MFVKDETSMKKPCEFKKISSICFFRYTFPVGRAGTVVAVPIAVAGTAVGAGITGAVVDRAVRWITHKARLTDALQSRRSLEANAVRRTGSIFALSLAFAVLPGETRRAFAVISADLVDAGSSVLARRREALVQIQLAVLSPETLRTIARVSAVSVETLALVKARIVHALVDVYFAIRSVVPETK